MDERPVLDYRREHKATLPRNFWCGVGILFLVGVAFVAMVVVLIGIWS